MIVVAYLRRAELALDELGGGAGALGGVGQVSCGDDELVGADEIAGSAEDFGPFSFNVLERLSAERISKGDSGLYLAK